MCFSLRIAASTALIFLAACTSGAPQATKAAPGNDIQRAPENLLLPGVRVEAPPKPGSNASAPTFPHDDPTPVSEAPFVANSAQGAASLVQTYYALLEAGRSAAAYRLWSGEGEASGLTPAAFAERRSRYREYHAEIFAPGEIEGAAGSLYVEVPVRVYGRTASGEAFSRRGTVTLRRVNDVPGSTPEQRRWHIARSDVEPPR